MERLVDLDHVILGTRDLERAARRLLDEFGLGSVPGGRHQGWGTANRIVPLGSSYLEIMGVADAAEAAKNFLGRYLQEQTREGDALVGWCVAVQDIEGTANRLGLEIVAGSRERPDGEVLRWRLAGLSEAFASRYLPFFISWDVPAQLHPARMKADYRVDPAEILSVAVSGRVDELSKWLGDQQLPRWVDASDGPPGLHSVSIGIKSSAGSPQGITLR